MPIEEQRRHDGMPSVWRLRLVAFSSLLPFAKSSTPRNLTDGSGHRVTAAAVFSFKCAAASPLNLVLMLSMPQIRRFL